MAFGFGVGDILAVTKIIVNAIRDIHDAPTELQEIAERVETVDLNLQSIDKFPSISATGNEANIERLVNRVKEVLEEIKDIVVKYGDTRGWGHAFARTRYGVWEKDSVGNLVEQLEQRTRDLSFSILVQVSFVTNQMRPQIDQILTAIQRQQREGIDYSISQDTQSGSSGRQLAEADKVCLKQSQLDQIQSILERILLSGERNNLITSSSREESSKEQQKDAQVGENVGAKLSAGIPDESQTWMPHPEDTDPISYLGGKNRLEIPKGWIMVVDKFNEVRSIIAQIYLELVRVWTVNNGGEWLFNRVESAGVDVETKFAKRARKSQAKSLVKGSQPPEKAALEAISGTESFFRSEEKDAILERVAQHRSRGIDNWHFRKFEYMLCFDRSVYITLKEMAESCKKMYGDMPSYANLSRIILVKDVKLDTALSELSVKEQEEFVGSIKSGIKTFLRTELGWQRPPLPMVGGPFRTKQIVLRNDDIKLSLDEKEIKLDEIAQRTGCRIRVTDEKFDGQLFSISGPERAALSLAASLLNKAFL